MSEERNGRHLVRVEINGRRVRAGSCATADEADALRAEIIRRARAAGAIVRQAPARRQGRVYFVRPVGLNLVKIGYSRSVRKRVRDLQTANGGRLTLLCTMRGSISEERALHRRFASARREGEWFELTPEIESFISEHRKTRKSR